MLGLNFFLGRGVPKDLAANHKYLSLAAAQGLEQAKITLKKYFLNGAPGKLQGPMTSASSSAKCGVASSNLRACARCKASSYCSKECQAMHWNAGHKRMFGASTKAKANPQLFRHEWSLAAGGSGFLAAG